MHLLSDATYELLVDFEVTKASNSEVKETEKLLDNIKENIQRNIQNTIKDRPAYIYKGGKKFKEMEKTV